MPLPAALAARLAKRGILKPVPGAENSPANDALLEPQPAPRPAFEEPEEEIIAEDYDDPDEEQTTGRGSQDDEDYVGKPETSSSGTMAKTTDRDFTAVGCPNKYNIYHDCSEFCRRRWAHKIDEEPSGAIKRKFKKLLKLHPLPEGWIDVWEPGMGIFYFWNTAKDEVSWMPPGHPEAHISPSVPQLKVMMRNNELGPDQQPCNKRKANDDEDKSDDEDAEEEEDGTRDEDQSDDESEDSDSDDSQDEPPEIRSHNRTQRHEIPTRRRFDNPEGQRRNPPGRQMADPMDPSSYAGVPRGKWSDGLGQE